MTTRNPSSRFVSAPTAFVHPPLPVAPPPVVARPSRPPVAVSVIRAARQNATPWWQVVDVLYFMGSHPRTGRYWTAHELHRYLLRTADLWELLDEASVQDLEQTVAAEQRSLERIGQRALRSVLAGQSFATVAHRFNQMKLRGTSGRVWTPAAVRDLVASVAPGASVANRDTATADAASEGRAA